MFKLLYLLVFCFSSRKVNIMSLLVTCTRASLNAPIHPHKYSSFPTFFLSFQSSHILLLNRASCYNVDFHLVN